MIDRSRRTQERAIQTAVNQLEHQQHLRRVEGLNQYSPLVLPLLHHIIETQFGEEPGYGVDDQLDEDEGVQRYGWRIFGSKPGEYRFGKDFHDTPLATQRHTLLTVEIEFGPVDQPIGFLVDTRRSKTVVKSGFLGRKQTSVETIGSLRKVTLSQEGLAAALEQTAPMMKR